MSVQLLQSISAENGFAVVEDGSPTASLVFEKALGAGESPVGHEGRVILDVDDLKAVDLNDDEELLKKYPGGLFEGHAAMFDNIDLQGDVITRGAFKKTIRENKKGVPVLDNHRLFDGTGAVIGKTLVLSEDDKGLYFKAYLSQTSLAQEIRTKIAEGLLSKMSIGFRVIKADGRPDGAYELKELQLREISVVVFPANPKAAIASVKNAGVGIEACTDATREFDAELASARWQKWVFDNTPGAVNHMTPGRLKAIGRGYAVVDLEQPTREQAYKHLLVDVVDGEPLLVKAAIEAAITDNPDGETVEALQALMAKHWPNVDDVTSEKSEPEVVEPEPVAPEPEQTADISPLTQRVDMFLQRRKQEADPNFQHLRRALERVAARRS